jgi:hypothetical protein
VHKYKLMHRQGGDSGRAEHASAAQDQRDQRLSAVSVIALAVASDPQLTSCFELLAKGPAPLELAQLGPE